MNQKISTKRIAMAGLMAALTIDEANGLLYTMNFIPYSPEFASLATEILCTFGYIE